MESLLRRRSIPNYNLYGVLIGEGVADQDTDRVVIEGMNVLYGPAFGEFEIIGNSVMQGIVCYTNGCPAVTLTR